MIIKALKRPWRRIEQDQESENMFVMAKKNYKILPYSCLTLQATTRVNTVPDTGADSGFVRHLLVPCKLQKEILII